jgi:hypothetical protein
MFRIPSVFFILVAIKFQYFTASFNEILCNTLQNECENLGSEVGGGLFLLKMCWFDTAYNVISEDMGRII